MIRRHGMAGTCALKAVVSAVLLFLAACGPDQPAAPDLPYDDEYPEIGYGQTRPAGSLGRAMDAIADGSVRIAWDADRGYLAAVLDTLAIDPSSQVLAFSRTSLQTRFIGPQTPRAIYFNDDTYVAWTPGAPTLEISGFDPALGPVFYTVVQEDAAKPVPERKFGVCLRCHDTYSLTGGGVPRFLLGSGYTNTEGELVSHEAWILTTQATPLGSRWGGWYVTGHHGGQVHLGNIVVEAPEDLQDLEALRVGNIDTLDTLLDTSLYLQSTSDIVALMVLEHQIEVQNLISRLRYESVAGRPIAEHAAALASAMLMRDAITLAEPISGNADFSRHFEARGPFDSAGRSLRQLDLRTRVFRYPLSYLIYSAGFQALPGEAKTAVYRNLRASMAELAAADRDAITAILRDTLPEAIAD